LKPLKIGKIEIERILKSKSVTLKHLIETKLWLKVIIGLVMGILVGLFLGPDIGLVTEKLALTLTNWLALPGQLFIQLIKMIIVPLVFSSIIIGMVSSGSPDFLKKIGPRIAVYFLITTTIATIIGISVAYLIQPGAYIAEEFVMSETANTVASSTDLANIPSAIANIVPGNPFEAIVKGDMLGVVIFTIIIGLAFLFLKPEKIEPAIKFLQVIQDICMRIVKWAMAMVPYAVFGLMTQVTAQTGLKTMVGLGMYMLTVLIGLFLLVVVYNLIVLIFLRKNPFKFMGKIKNALLVAFSTSSSAATMPLSIKIAEDKLKVKPAISEFIIPVGATINMDGTALYQVVATIFLAQVFGIHLALPTLILIIAVTVGASIGAPSAPGTGIIILATILESAGIPGAGIALILGVDRILDMCRTSVNVTGDLTACYYFDNKLDKFFKKDKTKAVQVS